MPALKRILCLANSRKLNGRCIAGKEFDRGRGGAWVRPVSAREHGEVSEYERQYEDGSDPCVMDILDVPLSEHRPTGYQQENWLLDPEQYWRFHARAARSVLAGLVDAPAPLWVNGNHTYHGRNDRVPLALADGIDSSLRLLRVEGLTLAVFSPSAAFGNPKRRVQARFEHAGTEYRLRVTDPVYERAYLRQADGEYPLAEHYLTISLGEAYEGACYKLVAAVIDPAGGLRA